MNRGAMPQETFLETAEEVVTGYSLRNAASKYGTNFKTLPEFFNKIKTGSDDPEKTVPSFGYKNLDRSSLINRRRRFNST
ncbi:hypothetical protein AVEN_164290-1 [Araneus ventricosus]|uniref:Uncharacterized protein n=1 Tax=Araneus ventricosus TaxID=182803 RepID=A0A4Y2H196_ARAVE|nr:hypothetical protein AVEN_164290-1 [Araneus ventricosus]